MGNSAERSIRLSLASHMNFVLAGFRQRRFDAIHEHVSLRIVCIELAQGTVFCKEQDEARGIDDV